MKKFIVSVTLGLVLASLNPVLAVAGEVACRLVEFQPDRELNLRPMPSPTLKVGQATGRAHGGFSLESSENLLSDERLFVTIRKGVQRVAEGFLPPQGARLSGSGSFEIYSAVAVVTRSSPQKAYVMGAQKFAGPLLLSSTTARSIARDTAIQLDPVDGAMTYAYAPRLRAVAGQNAFLFEVGVFPGPSPFAEGKARVRIVNNACYHCIPSLSCVVEDVELPAKVCVEGGGHLGHSVILGVTGEVLIPTARGDWLSFREYLDVVEYAP